MRIIAALLAFAIMAGLCIIITSITIIIIIIMIIIIVQVASEGRVGWHIADQAFLTGFMIHARSRNHHGFVTHVRSP